MVSYAAPPPLFFVLWRTELEEVAEEDDVDPQATHRPPHRRPEGDSGSGAVSRLAMSPVSVRPS